MKAAREGFSLVEVVVGFLIVGIVMTTLAGMTYATAAQALIVSDQTTRDARALERLNQLHTLPWAALPAQVGCDTVGTARNRFARCVTLVEGSRQRTLQLTTTPLQRRQTASTLRLIRHAPPAPNPLCNPTC